MKVLFVCGLFNAEQEKFVIENSKKMPNMAANVHQWNIVNGLPCNVTIFNSIFVGNFPFDFKKIYLKKSIWSHNSHSVDISIPSLNIFGIKQLCRARRLKREIRRWMMENNESDSVVLIYSMNNSFLSAYKKARFGNFKGKSCLIVPDLPLFYINNSGKNFLYRFFKRIDWRSMLKNINCIDSFILLTDQMKDILHIGNKSYCISEGIAEVEGKNNRAGICNYNVFAYTGRIDREYGILDLLKAFVNSKLTNWNLVIAGDGNAKKEVEQYCRTYSNIKYLGVLNHSDTLELQRSSTILINPRSEKETFTRYSFPSKTMEYLSSGRPVLMNKLPGIPSEYDEYLLYFKDSTVNSMAETLKDIALVDYKTLNDIGEKGKRFVNEEKNTKVQGLKLYNFLINLTK